LRGTIQSEKQKIQQSLVEAYSGFSGRIPPYISSKCQFRKCKVALTVHISIRSQLVRPLLNVEEIQEYREVNSQRILFRDAVQQKSKDGWKKFHRSSIQTVRFKTSRTSRGAERRVSIGRGGGESAVGKEGNALAAAEGEMFAERTGRTPETRRFSGHGAHHLTYACDAVSLHATNCGEGAVQAQSVS
jgi:hypothetical protein